MPIEVRCENCGMKTFKQSYELRKYSHHFCTRKCAFAYRKKHGYSKRSRNSSHLKKLVTFAEIRENMMRSRL